MNPAEDVTDQLQKLLSAHGLRDTPRELIGALAGTVRRLRKNRSPPEPALGARERKRALACACTLLRHRTKPPRRPETTDDKRRKLIELLDSVSAVVKVSAKTGYNIVPILESLKAGEVDAAELSLLIDRLQMMEPGVGAARPNAPYVPLLRAGVIAWEAEREDRYTALTVPGVDTPEDIGPDTHVIAGSLPCFLRALLDFAGQPQPSDAALHRHLSGMKNL